MSSDSPQDPCRQWLGIDAADLGDHRRVLGVTPDERDPLAVLRAAENRLTRLRSVSAGPLEFVRAGFVKRVEAARESVLAEIAAGAAPPAAAGFHPPPAPSTVAPPRPVRPVPPAVPVPSVSPPAVPAPLGPPGVGGGGPAPITVRTTIYRKQTPVLGISLAMIGLTMLAGGLGYYVLVVKPQQALRREQLAAARQERAKETQEADAPPARDAASQATPSATDADRPPPRARPRRPRTNASEPAAVVRDVRAGAATVDPPVVRPRPADASMAKPRPAAETSDDEAKKESRLLDESLAEVLDAERDGRVDAVETLLKSAAGRGRSPDGRRRVAGWQRLVAAHRKYFENSAAALDAVKPGAAYEIGGKKVVIDRIDEEKCVFRAAGPPKTVPREKIPAGIVMAIVSAWGGEDPDTDVAIAAYQLFRQEPELRLARERLEKARDAGADVETLLSLLDDPLFAAAAEGK